MLRPPQTNQYADSTEPAIMEKYSKMQYLCQGYWFFHYIFQKMTVCKLKVFQIVDIAIIHQNPDMGITYFLDNY